MVPVGLIEVEFRAGNQLFGHRQASLFGLSLRIMNSP
jgi:hypothetical protein